MSYRPKSTYQILKTSGKEYETLTGTPYSGPYILTSEGAFIGNDITSIGPRLIKTTNKLSLRTNNISENPNTNEYYRANQNTVKFIQNTSPIISTKVKPNKKEYEKGHYTRYFAKKVNSITDYYEIDNKTYKAIKAKSSSYDFYSFEVGNLIWALEGDVIKTNKSILLQKEKKYPNISSLFKNLGEFIKPKNKKQKVNLSKVTTKTQTRGFIHNVNINDVPYIPPKKIKEILEEQTTQAVPQSTPIIPSISSPMSPPSTGGGSSGGGGGGY